MDLQQGFLNFPTTESKTVQNKNYSIRTLDCDTAKRYIIKNHYSHGCHNGPFPCYGLIENENLIGVLMFATPCSEAVRSSVFGEEMKDSVIELHRLHILDITPKNTESWFISRCLKLLKEDDPKIKAVISFSDSTEGHNGIIYQATNFYYIGKTGSAVFYKDMEGRLHHPRQCGVNITKEMAQEKKWIPEVRTSKNRYLYILAKSKTEKKELLKKCKYDVLHKKWCKACGKEMDIENYYDVCDDCLDKEGGRK